MTSMRLLQSAFLLFAVSITFNWETTSAVAQDGQYVIETWVGRYHDVKIQPDQKIIAGGNWLDYASNDAGVAVARYDFDGVADTTFGMGGVTMLPAGYLFGDRLAIQSDGKIVITAASSSKLGAARFKANGVLDTTFGSGGFASVVISGASIGTGTTCLGLQSNGKVVVGGRLRDQTGTESPALARFLTTGALDSGKSGFGVVSKGKYPGYAVDSSFGPRSDGQFEDLVVQPDDKIVLLGTADDGSNSHEFLTRYTAAGQLDKTFNGTGYNGFTGPHGTVPVPRSIVRQADGKYVIAGQIPGVDGFIDLWVARFNTNGTLDTNFNGGTVTFDIDSTDSETTEWAYDLAIQSDGKIVAAGSFHTAASSETSVLVVRFYSDGTLDETFGAGGYKLGMPPAGPDVDSFHSYAVALQADSSIIVAGAANHNGEGIRPLLMRFDP